MKKQRQKEENISLAVLDLNLDDEDGLEAVHTIRAKKTSVPIIVYSIYADKRHIEKALQYGTQGYITKNHSTDELESAIKIVTKGDLCYSMAASMVIQKKLFGKAAGDSEAGSKSDSDFYKRYGELSKSEQEVFMLLAEKKKTVLNQRTIVYQKLYLEDTLELIDYAKKLGVIV